MLPQSKGSVTLASSNLLDAALSDPNFFTHHFDDRVMIEGVRQTLELLDHPSIKKGIVGTLRYQPLPPTKTSASI
jgi:hypothetical protein